MPRADLGAGPSAFGQTEAESLAKEIESVKKEVRDIKEELSKIPEDSERRNVLEPGLQTQLGGLQMQLGALRQERLLQRQEGAMPLHACHRPSPCTRPPDLPALMCTCMMLLHLAYFTLHPLLPYVCCISCASTELKRPSLDC